MQPSTNIKGITTTVKEIGHTIINIKNIKQRTTNSS